jgi:hypothetical protein
MADKALILGINHYKSVNGLRGCENDVENMRRLLTETFGFTAENVRTLVNSDVTKAKVSRQIASWLFKDLEPGDRVALHFSGHGSYTADLDGEPDEDGLDELICMVDMDFDRPGSYLLDDDLRELLGRCPKDAALTVFLDNCHSGTGTRLLVPPDRTRPAEQYPRIVAGATAHRVVENRLTARGLELATTAAVADVAAQVLEPTEEERVVARFVEPPQQIVERARAIRALRSRRGLDRSTDSLTELVPGMNHVLLAAAQADQTAADAYIGGTFNGAFTYYLCKILRDSGRMLDRGVLIERLRDALKAGHYAQLPRLEGPVLGGPLFTAGSPAEPKPSGSGSIGSPPTPVDLPKPATPPPSPVVGGESLYRELLATYNRLLDLIRPSGVAASGPTAAAGLGRAAGTRHVVYVHGIGAHQRDWSWSWFQAMAPYTPSLRPGDLGGTRHEAYWSDLVNTTREIGPEPQAREVADRLREAVAQRMDQQVVATAAVAQATGQGPEAARGLGDGGAQGLPLAAARGRLSGLEGFDDFGRYLASRDLRFEVIDRFREVVRPLLAEGVEIEVIAHSWGTVVAYEALRLLDAEGGPGGAVRNFFTVGSALSIGEVRRRLLPEAIDGRKPRLVARWLNLAAHGDVIGGRLDDAFGIDLGCDFLNLPATDCGRIFWVLPDPVCAHGSYFDRDNAVVNQGIFGRFIEGH